MASGCVMRIRNKRLMLAQAMRWSGVLGVLERVARRPCVVVLVYHRIAEPGRDGFYSPLISATPDAFRSQMRWLNSRFRMLTLREFEHLIWEDEVLQETPISPTEPCALVTFDDGYRDNLELAAPITRELGIAPTLFVTTGFLGGEQIPWWDQAAGIVRASERPRIVLERPDRLEVTLQARERDTAIATIIGAYIGAGWTATGADLAHLADRAGVRIDDVIAAARGLFLDASDLPLLRAAGWSIGAHTRTHHRLSSLGAAAVSDELQTSRAELERITGEPVDAFAYPYGDTDAFDHTTEELVRGAGYDLAFALRPRVIRPGPINRFAIPRIAVGHADSLALLRARVALARLTDRVIF
jgi:peptidoglycan/xylan/chitin deacetylase (PgdA/CDA1 family)